MLVKSMRTVAGLRGSEPLTAAYRAGLRSRTYGSASLNRPAAEPDIFPVTTVDGAKLRVHAYGPADADAIVLIHGWSCCIEYWNPQINAFAENFRVISYDQRGHGDSGLGRLAPSGETFADDLATVLDATLRPGQKALLVGHSMGGITIQAWAQRYPEQVARRAAGVILANTAAKDIKSETDLLPLLNKQLSVGGNPLTLLGAAVRMPMFVAEALLFAPVPVPDVWPVGLALKHRVMTSRATDEQVSFALDVVRSCRPLSRGLHAAALAELDLGEAAAHLASVPTTVIAGEHDKLLPERLSRPIVQHIVQAGGTVDYQVWPTGHLGNVEEAERFNAEIARMAGISGGVTAVAG
ncbi:alpha/beta fold hydrolase [Nocardia harenae]|uniref:alpha/beta fold hydrolase n=1 Tax=Nocardia harenae TaxID=358707 RepID=UPI000831AECB|nr:alpha/beta hydrolase [Nocardia harenae]